MCVYMCVYTGVNSFPLYSQNISYFKKILLQHNLIDCVFF